MFLGFRYLFLNEVQNDKCCLFAAVPDPPEDPEVLSQTKQSVTLSWFTPLHNGGSPIVGYRVEMRLADSALWLPCHSEPVCNTEFVVANLTPGSGYRFRVAAVNTAGSGEPVELPQTVQLGEELHALVVFCSSKYTLSHNSLHQKHWISPLHLYLCLNILFKCCFLSLCVCVVFYF